MVTLYVGMNSTRWYFKIGRRGTVTMSRQEIDPSLPLSPCSAVWAPGAVGSAPGGVGSPPGGVGSLPGGDGSFPGGLGSLAGGVGSCARAVRKLPHRNAAAQRATTLARPSNLRMLTSRDTAFESPVSTAISIRCAEPSSVLATISCAFFHNQVIY